MTTIIDRLFRQVQTSRGCIVVAGNDIQYLSQLFVKQHSLPVYQVLHDQSLKSIQVQSHYDGLTTVRLNLTDEVALKALLKHIAQAGHVVELCIFQPTFRLAHATSSLSSRQLEQLWQNTGLSAASLAQVMISSMLKQQCGTLIFLGGQHQASEHYDVPEQSMFAGIRALSQSLAREFQPKGLHIVYCMPEQWQGENQHLMQSIKTMCWHLYQQPDSTWSQELSI